MLMILKIQLQVHCLTDNKTENLHTPQVKNKNLFFKVQGVTKFQNIFYLNDKVRTNLEFIYLNLSAIF